MKAVQATESAMAALIEDGTVAPLLAKNRQRDPLKGSLKRSFIRALLKGAV